MTTINRLLEGKAGIRFLADVQGCFKEFAAVAEDALAKNLALFSLGDLIDRGPDSPSVMRLACDLHDSGHFDLVPGNYDEKFVRFIQGRPVSTARGLGDTLKQLLNVPDGKNLSERYFDMVCHARLWRVFAGGLHVVHAAMRPSMLGTDGPRLIDKAIRGSHRAYALFGESDGTEDPENPGRPRRFFTWVDRLPQDVTVLVGHSVISTSGIVERRGSLGGRVIHLDTGVDQGGRLSWLDIPVAMIAGTDPLRIPEFPRVPDQAQGSHPLPAPAR